MWMFQVFIISFTLLCYSTSIVRRKTILKSSDNLAKIHASLLYYYKLYKRHNMYVSSISELYYQKSDSLLGYDNIQLVNVMLRWPCQLRWERIIKLNGRQFMKLMWTCATEHQRLEKFNYLKWHSTKRLCWLQLLEWNMWEIVTATSHFMKSRSSLLVVVWLI